MDSCYGKLSVRLVLRVGICFALIFALHPKRFAVYYNFIPNEEIKFHLVPASTPTIQSCPLLPKLSFHTFKVNKTYNGNQSKYAADLKIKRGGFWQPDMCDYVYNVALIVPFRGRPQQLKTFLYHIHPFLQKQMISYRIFVIEQTFLRAFNRGLLLNIGFLEALRIYHFHCFIFHDVDLLPLVEYNTYACTKKPRHLSSAINSWRYNLKYITAFGGVTSILQNQFLAVNGFSNKYFGWGGEDDDFIERIQEKKIGFIRFSPEISKYYMLHHKPEKKNPERLNILYNAHDRFKSDGINSVNYTKLLFDEKLLYTHILIDAGNH